MDSLWVVLIAILSVDAQPGWINNEEFGPELKRISTHDLFSSPGLWPASVLDPASGLFLVSCFMFLVLALNQNQVLANLL